MGVDPGLTGAIVSINDKKLMDDNTIGFGVRFYPMPITREVVNRQTGRIQYRRSYDIPQLKALFLEIKERAGDERLLVAVEKLHAMPAKFRRKGSDEEIAGGGTIANFNRGFARGLFEGILRALGLPLLLVPPQTWQREMLRNVPDVGDTKERALAAAKLISKDLNVESLRASSRATKPHDGLVDGLLLASYALSLMQPKQPELFEAP